MQRTGSQIIVDTLIEQGVDVIFGYPGGAVLNIYDALYDRREDIRHILTSHEQGAAHAADGYSRSTGKVGVCLATSGPGATNLITGLATAYLDSVPMVALTGNVSLPMLGRDSFQEVDITGVTVPVTKHNFFVRDVNQIAETVKNAFTIAVSGRPGPVLIDVPKDLTAALAEYVPVGHYEKRSNVLPSEVAILQVAATLNKAKRPLIYFGGGVKLAGAEKEVEALAQKWDAPMASTSMGLSSVRYDHPLFLGMIGMHGAPVSNEAADECDVLLAVGARFSDRVTGDKTKFAPHAEIIHIDIDLSEIGKNVQVDQFLLGDAKEVLSKLIPVVEQGSHPEWLASLSVYKKEHPISRTNCTEGVDPRRVVEAVSRLMGEDVIVVTDVGQHQMLTAQNYQFVRPHTFISSCGLGTMGFGLGAANGVKVGNPDRPVVLITGDGCFHMNLNELAVGVTEKLPIVILVMNNGVLGMVRQWQKLFYEERYADTFLKRKSNFVAIAEGFGAKGMLLSNNADIDRVLLSAMEVTDRPVVIDCQVDKDNDVYPIIPAGKAFADMILED